MTTNAPHVDLNAQMDRQVREISACFETFIPLFEKVTKAIDDFAEAVRRDPQLARLIEEHARHQGLDRG